MFEICGYIILRKPEFNFDNEGRGSFSKIVPKIDDLIYSGVDRMPWFDLDEDFYGGSLPEELVAIRKELKDKNCDYTDFQVVRDFDKAKKILEYSNKNKSINELTAIYSKKIERVKGAFKCDTNIAWLGIDLYCHGYGSIVREGIFKRPELFPSHKYELNKIGLFNKDSELLEKYIKDYIICSKDNSIESINGALKYLDHILIGRVNRPLGE